MSTIRHLVITSRDVTASLRTCGLLALCLGLPAASRPARAEEAALEVLATDAERQLLEARQILVNGSPSEAPGAHPAVSILGRRRLDPGYRPDGSKGIKVAFFDADSTLRVSKSGSVSANGPSDVVLLPWVGGKLAELEAAGHLIAIVSNQGGIPQHISMETADAALSYTIRLIREQGGEVHYYDFAEHKDGDRKPQTGMAVRLEALLRDRFGVQVSIDRAASFMVGDSAYKRSEDGRPADRRPDGTPGAHFSNSDRLFAENLGVAFIEAADFFGWRRFGVDVFSAREQVDEFLRANPRP